MPVSSSYRPDPVYPQIGEGFFDPVEAADFPKTILRYRNDRWARQVGLEQLTDQEWQDHFGAFEPLPQNIEPAIGDALSRPSISLIQPRPWGRARLLVCPIA